MIELHGFSSELQILTNDLRKIELQTPIIKVGESKAL